MGNTGSTKSNKSERSTQLIKVYEGSEIFSEDELWQAEEHDWSDIKERKMPDGTYYTGEIIYKKREKVSDIGTIVAHGKGKKVWKDGTTYRGEWNEGTPVNYGKLMCPNGDIYEGYFRNYKVFGLCQLTKPNGSVYVGQW